VLSKLLLKYIFRVEDEIIVSLGTVKQKGSTVAILNSKQIWEQEPFKNKLKSIFRMKWQPSGESVQEAARQTLLENIFGTDADFGSTLFQINVNHNSIEWQLDSLTDFDNTRICGLQAMTILIRTRHRNVTSPYLHLNLGELMPSVCFLLIPMAWKVPVTSIQYYIDIDSAFTFNEIRKLGLNDADDLISYIYELQFIQQKIALSLHEYLCLVDYAERNKKTSLLINAELSAIIGAEVVFTYLKASIEKLIVVLGLLYGIKNLDAKKTHKQKISALDNGIPAAINQIEYFSFIFDFIQSEDIDELNSYRNGILHKRGIADLQPHNYVGKEAADVPLKKMFQVLIEQHAKNTAVLICIYALLTDKLMNMEFKK
jgi:hypothetical protein